MKKTIYFLIFIIPLLLNSCTGKEEKKQLSKIDSLSGVLAESEKKLTEINKDSVTIKYFLYEKTMDSVAKYFTQIRSDESWPYICAYREVRKPFRNIYLKYDLFKSELDSAKKQLDDLKHDIKKELIKNDEADLFIKNESNSVDAIYKKISKSIDLAEKHMKNFDTVHPYLIKLMNSKTRRNN